MNCGACGADNEAGRKFCGDCGARLSAACPACGTPNAPGTKFCGECGAGLAAAAAGAAATTDANVADRGAVPSTERRLVSVLFADLVGFTTISEQRDAEDVRDLLARYFERSREIIERYGGTVEKFIGDAVMAVWGTPTAQEDDAERAVRAALDLVDAISALGAERGIENLALRGGVHTGEAVVTIGASGMGMVAGDLVNTAARLQSVAEPGTVLVGEGTRRAADTAIVFDAAGSQTLKGKELPVAAFRAIRVVAQRGGVGRSEGLEPPFVGREAELRLIKDFYHATARDRAPRLVSVIGQAGIGKSRLAWEFLKYIDGVTEVVYWHQGRSPAYGDGISFWALGEMVRMRIGVGERAEEAETRERLTATLEEFVADADERRALTDPLLHLLGIGGAVAGDRGTLFGAWRAFFERIAEHAPVIMVFEDLQWADDGLLDFIEELLTWSRGRSLYLITLARAELLDRRPNWGAGQRSFTSLSLSPLGDADMRALLAGLVPGLPGEVIDGIVDRAEGIPLYAVETVRTLLNDGSIERDGDAFRLVGELRAQSVPESLQALIAARIDALPGAERTLVQDASVLGTSFPEAALRAVARSEDTELGPKLQHLVQREILVRDDDPRSPERGQYRFVQGLLREVAYGTLSRDDRRSRHLAAARHYESLGDDELSGVLAQHYVDAYQAHPDGPEGLAVATQARVALRAAASRATALGSQRRALSYLESAILVVSDPREELDLRSDAFDAAGDAGLLDDATAHARRAIALATELGHDGARRELTARYANILLEGHQQQAKQVVTEALAEPGLGPESDGWVLLTVIAAKTEMRMTNDERAVELADMALPHVQRAGEEGMTLDLIITRAVSLANLGRTSEAIVHLTGAFEVAVRKGLDDATNRAAVNLGYVLQPDDPQAALAVSKQALDTSIAAGVVWGIRYLLGNAVDAAIEIGDWDWALGMMDDHEAILTEPAELLWFGTFRNVIQAYRGADVLAASEALYATALTFDDVQYHMVGAYGLAVSLLLAGDTERLMPLVDDSLKGGLSGSDATIYAIRGAVWAGDVDTARRYRDLADRMPPGRRTATLRLVIDGGIAALEGRAAEARVAFGEAQRAWRDMDARFWLAMTDLDIVITGAMEPDERRRAAEEARAIFSDLRATTLLDKLDTALAGAEAHEQSRARAPSVVEAEIAQEA
ncbi:MAG TPA: adenylate/guanylate cyclase domain-containing protein [Candidatus Limnocylindria bacterium]